MRVTIFGGSRPRPGEPAYDQAMRLGQMLGAAGYTALTGGYIGTMEAVSRGAAESGGYVIGVTCDQIESCRPVEPNPWLHEEMRFPTIRQRLFALIENCDAALVLPGGIGTLAEVAEMWSHLQTGAISLRPLVLIGPGWKAIFEQFCSEFGEYVPKKYRRLLAFAPDVESAFIQLQESTIGYKTTKPGNEANNDHRQTPIA